MTWSSPQLKQVYCVGMLLDTLSKKPCWGLGREYPLLSPSIDYSCLPAQYHRVVSLVIYSPTYPQNLECPGPHHSWLFFSVGKCVFVTAIFMKNSATGLLEPSTRLFLFSSKPLASTLISFSGSLLSQTQVDWILQLLAS